MSKPDFAKLARERKNRSAAPGIPTKVPGVFINPSVPKDLSSIFANASGMDIVNFINQSDDKNKNYFVTGPGLPDSAKEYAKDAPNLALEQAATNFAENRLYDNFTEPSSPLMSRDPSAGARAVNPRLGTSMPLGPETAAPGTPVYQIDPTNPNPSLIRGEDTE